MQQCQRIMSLQQFRSEFESLIATEPPPYQIDIHPPKGEPGKHD